MDESSTLGSIEKMVLKREREREREREIESHFFAS